jgi:hypothetical protein
MVQAHVLIHQTIPSFCGYLTQSLGFVGKHIHWVAQGLTRPQKAEHSTRSKELLHQLLSIKHHGWQFILTFDESWFEFATNHGHIWLHPEEQPSERFRHTIQDPSMMVLIAWIPMGFHVLDSRPKGKICGAEYSAAITGMLWAKTVSNSTHFNILLVFPSGS